ncbi:MAG: fused MFS/spermidine synthase [Desulfomicrobium escambiense]|nr:fused MFS/spermidine synthase [Desulfomicrobium escambiense]
MGTGNLAMEFLKLLPEIKKIDIVEIDPAVIEIAGQHFDFIPDERININIQDARVFVRNSKIKYDLIILDIFSEQGLSYRFMTREFFLEISRALSNNGILASNIFSLWDLNSEKNTVFKALFNTYKSVFNAIKLFPA